MLKNNNQNPQEQKPKEKIPGTATGHNGASPLEKQKSYLSFLS